MKESACKMMDLCYNKGVPSYLDKRQMNAFQTCSGATFEETKIISVRYPIIAQRWERHLKSLMSRREVATVAHSRGDSIINSKLGVGIGKNNRSVNQKECCQPLNSLWQAFDFTMDGST